MKNFFNNLLSFPKNMKVPDRWLHYSSCSKIRNTRFVASKVPLPNRKNGVESAVRFTLEDLLTCYPDIKLVIDLTDTYKYYDGDKEFAVKGIKYVKLKCRGHSIPSNDIYNSFVSEVNAFLAENSNDGLICVHCTHGVNRTGYLICRYMISELGFSPEQSLNDFKESRGHPVERDAYINALMNLRRSAAMASSGRSIGDNGRSIQMHNSADKPEEKLALSTSKTSNQRREQENRRRERSDEINWRSSNFRQVNPCTTRKQNIKKKNICIKFVICIWLYLIICLYKK